MVHAHLMDGGGMCYWSQVGVARLVLVPRNLHQREKRPVSSGQVKHVAQ